jgi:hypothetical protein
MAALTRDELVKILTEIVHAARNRLLEARTADGLKAAEMLARMCGWNEPEQVKHDHVHLQVDSALIEQFRSGYAQLASKGAPFALQGDHAGGATPSARRPLQKG